MPKRERPWFDGTTLLAVLMERYAKGETLVVTRREVEDLAFGSKLPIAFEMPSDDGDTIRIRVVRPGDRLEAGDANHA